MTTITKSDIQALLLVTSKDITRAALWSINFEKVKDRILLVATDGRRLLALQRSFDADMPCPEGNLPRDVAEAMVKTATKPGERMCFSMDGTIRLGYVQTVLSNALVYPAWRKVVACIPSDKPAQFNPRFVADFGRIAKLLGNRTEHIGIRHNDIGAAFVALGVENAFAVLMPFRDETTASYTLPNWI